MISRSVDISDQATPVVNRVLGAFKSSQLSRYVGRAVQQEIGEHVLAFASSHHDTAKKLGASPTGFFGDAYEMVTSPGAVEAEVGEARLKLPRNAFARAFGDVDIFPGDGKKFLTIPACAEAYGVRAGAFNNLSFGIAFDPELNVMRPALVENTRNRS